MVEVGAQLYTLRDFTQTPKDFERTISKVAAIGYKTVQLSAVGASVTPQIAREICDKYGIRIVLTHSPVDRILHDTENLIHDHEVMGCKYIGLGSMPLKYEDPNWIQYFVEDFKGPLDMIRDAGMLSDSLHYSQAYGRQKEKNADFSRCFPCFSDNRGRHTAESIGRQRKQWKPGGDCCCADSDNLKG